MRARTNLCAMRTRYARSERDMRAQTWLCAMRTRYTRSSQFMRGQLFQSTPSHNIQQFILNIALCHSVRALHLLVRR